MFSTDRTRAPRSQAARLLLIIVAALLLQACDAELYTGLSEREANVMVATLARHGIPAKRVAEDEGRMTVTVDEDSFAEAVEILDRLGLPQERFTNLGEVFQNNSLVSSPVQERAQMIYALSEELSHTVSQVDGVLSARVHVVLPENDLMRQNSTPSSASVFVRHAPELDVGPLIPRIKTLVANGISGLAYDNVSVVPVAAMRLESRVDVAPSTSSFLGIAMPATSVGRAGWIFGILIVLVLGLAGALGWMAWQRRRRDTYELETPP
ncbi:type III secretion system inner membrane ring lipoprotein SctJ [Halomonas heilongjiangensis]|uniref:Lipoprotein n=1 Tax=Halomonas heilongjiangensis TaxID=1387883 RepID=A0A2N7TPU8_9GAMM|nr:type III secretion inner membrane ring lipoprotein SctJ [Halomonas heilongjiangensis]PMR70128.1 EscJ/YscJ/HrcJ family type III secretion inner membrane ring protein [Halomonas heilongjiangensis]PXX94492.1 EscJ/YscJ/HrcJ family type III secretion inner membrane ring protein [Halomonas heilongjiangensis]